ncbi:O-methyltransferase [Dentipellis sp. KUC8613]|nr:O-methyltransferase [Dentipellis sp. KUC8613]
MSHYRSNGANALAELKALASLIQSNVGRIEAAAASESLEFPSLWTTFSPQSEAARQSPDIADATAQIVAAASQLIAAVRAPPLTVMSLGLSFYIPASLRVAVDAHVAESLRDTGHAGSHVTDIAKLTNIDPNKLARILRLLATHHIFVEVSPDTFANNRLSSFLDSGKDVQALVAHPDQMYDGTSGITAVLGHFGDESFKAAAYLADVISNPEISHSYESNKSAANKAFNTDLDLFSWFETPGNEHRIRRIGHAMNGSQALSPPNAILEGFDWKNLKEGAIVVDVGGGVGAQSLVLANNFSHLHFIVQDRAAVVPEAEKFWQINKPDYVNAGKVEFQAYDFLGHEQPVKNADVLLLRAILHDWSDQYCIKILRNLREAATPHTRLLIIDHIISYACKDEAARDVPGVAKPLPPAPLLPHWGQASVTSYLGDMQMLTLCNGQERTATQLRDLLAQTGWKLVEVRRGPGLLLSFQNAIAVPV